MLEVRPPSKVSWKEEQDWDRLDKRKFFGYGSLLFGSVALGLFPLSVLKTRMMAGRDRSGPRNARLVLRSLYNEEGIKGLYRGLGTVLAGKIPSRFVYLGSLETFKSAAAKAVGDGWVSDAVAAGVVNFGAGAASSLVTQCIFVPVDVVSQRQMVDKALTHRPNGFRVVWDIWKNEGTRGLYRGFGISVATFVPTSAIWWGSYGMYQELLWNYLHEINYSDQKVSEEDVAQSRHQGGDRTLVQAVSGILAGSTAAFLTNPLDVVKTRLQVAPLEAVGKAPLIGKVIMNILEENGIRGMYKGVVPRMASMSLWGSCMISAYEVLKRISTIPTTGT